MAKKKVPPTKDEEVEEEKGKPSKGRPPPFKKKGQKPTKSSKK